MKDLKRITKRVPAKKSASASYFFIVGIMAGATLTLAWVDLTGGAH